MTSPNIPRVIEFLSANPRGVYGWQIAGHLDVNAASVAQTLALMLERAQIVVIEKDRSRANSVWRLPLQEESTTPPIFRALETLKAFQSEARKQLLTARESEAVCA